MARSACTFKQQDVTRALRATLAAGVTVLRVEIDKGGKIVVVTGELQGQGIQRDGENEWDNL